MYCPNCGQQQISGEMRFCSRCGLLLSGLAEWLAGSRLPLQREDESRLSVSPRRKGIRRAAKLMFGSGVLFFPFLALSLAIEEGVPMIVPFFVFFVALVWMLYALLFSDQTVPVNYQAPPSALGATSARSSLPPVTNTSIPGVGRQRAKTNELAQPPSVTEQTTRLLGDE